MKSPCTLLIICFAFASFASAQQTTPAKTVEVGDPVSKPISVDALDFSKPLLVEGVSAGSMLAGRFDCDESGTIYTLLAGGAQEGDPDSHLALMAIHPGGQTTDFPWWSIPGLANVSMPKAIFVGNGHVYVLVKAQNDSEQSERPSRYPTILIFALDGQLENTVKLEVDWNPLAFGVFPSGDILLASEDRLNHRMDVSLVNSEGEPIREISLGKNDFVTRAAQMPQTSRGSASYSPTLLISMSKFVPHDGHLLLVPLETADLPIVELDERGVIGLTTPRLPANYVLEGFISSSASAYTLRLAKLVQSDKGVRDAQGKALGIATEPSQGLTEISREDGSVLRQIDLGSPGVYPACEANGSYRLLTSGSEKRLQVVAARSR